MNLLLRNQLMKRQSIGGQIKTNKIDNKISFECILLTIKKNETLFEVMQRSIKEISYEFKNLFICQKDMKR